jgi:hypothetical protein
MLPSERESLPARSSRSPALTRLIRRAVAQARRMRADRLVQAAKESAVVRRLLFRPLRETDRATATDEDAAYARDLLLPDTRLLDRQFGTDYAAAWWGETRCPT